MINNFQNFLNRFNNFRNTYNGNPEQQVQQLLNSGKVSQEQYNQAVQQTNQLYQMFFKK